MVFAKEPMLAGEGTNPNVYLQFFDDEGKAMSDEMPFDRCRKLLDTVYSHVEVQAELALDLNLDSCRASEGPYVDAVGDVKMGGVNGRMVFRRHQRGTAETNALSGLEFNVTLPGATFDVDPQTLAGGAGGNSYVFLQFLGDGAPISEEVYLGRCGKF